MRRLGKAMQWPIAVATLSGGAVMVRESTDFDTHLVFDRTSAGFRVPVLGSASGRVILAHLAEPARDAALAMAIEAESAAGLDRGYWLRLLGDVRKAGYAVFSRPGAREGSVAAPVFGPDGAVRAALSTRYFEAVLSRAQAIETLRPAITAAADEISTALRATAA
jgi:IclR family mhp operon transcriptional activator